MSNAYWKEKTHFFSDSEYICSKCGYVADRAYKQCPACGADMSKSKPDGNWVDEEEMLDILLED